MKRLLLSLIVFIPCNLFGQTSNFYTFKTDNRTYTELTADTPIVPADFGTGNMWAFELNGETFSFFGKNYLLDGSKKLIMFSNSGHMRIDDDTSHIIIDGLFTYLDSIDQNSILSYKVEGTGSDKILKVQWKNLKIRSGAAGNFVNFQMWLYKATGIVEVHYGPSSANNKSGYNSQTGPNVGLFFSPKDFSRMLEKIWITMSPDNYTIDSARNVVFNAMYGVPQNGTIYRFVPKHVATTIVDKLRPAISISPNPADKEIALIFNEPLTEKVEVLIVDMQGRVAHKETFQESSMNIYLPMRTFAPGNYYLNITGPLIQHRQQLSIRH